MPRQSANHLSVGNLTAWQITVAQSSPGFTFAIPVNDFFTRMFEALGRADASDPIKQAQKLASWVLVCLWGWDLG